MQVLARRLINNKKIMKNIELTENHKSKLLEMCKVLFPKNKTTIQNEDEIKILTNYKERSHTNNSKIKFGEWDDIIIFHWFEFCMTHLAEKLYYKMGFTTRNISDMGNILFNEYFNNHINPIDYLYEEFKKLK